MVSDSAGGFCGFLCAFFFSDLGGGLSNLEIDSIKFLKFATPEFAKFSSILFNE
jgi:hypothetical protein